MLDVLFSMSIEYPVLSVRDCILNEERKLVSVGMAAKKAGVSRQSVQYYLMVGLVKPVEVTPTGRRLFDQKSIERIKLIKNLNDNGYTLRAIREIFLHGRTDLKGTER